MKAGDEVILLTDIYHDADDHAPFYVYAHKGERGIIQDKTSVCWDYIIAIRDIPDLGVNRDEIAEWVDCDQPDYTFLSDSKEGKCGKEGIQHKMKRWNCYHTSCINKGCKYKI